MQRSFVVHESLSLHDPVLLVYRHSPAVQESFVHALPSSQSTGVYAHLPFTDESTVHGSLSLQSAPQPGITVPVQVPFEQRSFLVHSFPSLQETELFVRSHCPLTHRSFVQGLLSLQLASDVQLEHRSPASSHVAGGVHGVPAWMLQLPPPQVSAPLQYRASLQGFELFGCVHWLFT